MKYTLFIIGVVVVLLIVFFALNATRNTQTPVPTTPEVTQPMPVVMNEDDGSAPVTEMEVENEVVFDVKGRNYEFDVTEIRVQEGDIVTINFESEDGFHDWMLDEFNAATEQVNPGTVTSVTFVAATAGEYEYYCSVGRHREMGMVGTFIVEAQQ